MSDQLVDRMITTKRILVSGGVGDFLQFLPFMLKNPQLPYLVHTHFKRAGEFFPRLGLVNVEYQYFANLAELRQTSQDLVNRGLLGSCPRTLFFDENPFESPLPIAPSGRKHIGFHLNGSEFSIDVLSKANWPLKEVPPQLVEAFYGLPVNILVFGTADELQRTGLQSNENIKMVCFENIADSLQASTSCDFFIGADSCFKTMSSMLRIPTYCLLSDIDDSFRDKTFIDEYVSTGVMRVYRYKNLTSEFRQVVADIKAWCGYSDSAAVCDKTNI